VHIGDKVRLKLTNSTKVKGHIISIDSTLLTVDTTAVQHNEIVKISTKNSGSLLGAALIAVGVISFVSYDPCIELFSSPPPCCNEDILIVLGLSPTGAGVAALVSPGYHKIG